MNFTGYLLFLTLIIIVLSYYVWCFCSKKSIENFNQTNWADTLKCLGFENKDLNQINEYLLNGEDPQTMITKIVNIASKKNLTDDKIFGCLTGDSSTKEEFTPNNPYCQPFAPLNYNVI